MKIRLLDTFSALAFIAVVLAAGWVVFATSAPASDQHPPLAVKAAAVQAGGRNLIDIGTSEGTFLVTIRSGTVTIESANILTLGPTVVVPPPTNPPPVDPPPPTNPPQSFAAALAKVTEAGKATTAANLNGMLKPVIDAATSGKLTDLAETKSTLPTILTLATLGKADWSEFNSLLRAGVEQASTIVELATVLKAASSELAKVK